MHGGFVEARASVWYVYLMARSDPDLSLNSRQSFCGGTVLEYVEEDVLLHLKLLHLVDVFVMNHATATPGERKEDHLLIKRCSRSRHSS